MKILVAIDGSPAALNALRHVIGLVLVGLNTRLLLAPVQAPTYVYDTTCHVENC